MLHTEILLNKLGPGTKLFFMLNCFIYLDTLTITEAHLINENQFIGSNWKENIVLCHNGSKNIYKASLYGPYLQEDYLFSVEWIESLEKCIQKCCQFPSCQRIIYSEHQCYGVSPKFGKTSFPISQNDVSGTVRNDLNAVQIRKKREFVQKNSMTPTSCTVGLLNCKENEFCKTKNNRRRNGICECKDGYQRRDNGICIQDALNTTSVKVLPSSSTTPSPELTHLSTLGKSDKSSVLSPAPTGANKATDLTSFYSTDANMGPTVATSAEPLKKLVVNIGNKTVTLPDGETHYKETVTLSAYALGDTGSMYKFSWNLLNQPDSKEGQGTIRGANSQTISLSDLVAGVYIFKVSVSGSNSYGETTGNVTVLPAKHVNKPPVAAIVPSSQKVQLPSTGVILDGSGSTDDKKITSFQWELLMGPLGYKLKEEDGPTLQMTDLKPGNYTIMLKVKDEEGLEGNSTASVVIVKETDYPPNANAGGDKIIYLPQTEITLNGNRSTDDHEIVEWEWTKGPEDSGNAVDMQDTRTPHLHLSNLEEGHYHFILKVVDSIGQASNSSSHLYVHPASDNMLIANAGGNKTVVIPNTTVTLDGSKTTGVTPQTHFLWKQLSGPNQAHLSSPNKIKTNASELTRGEYSFQLTIWNSQGNFPNSSSVVFVTVIQDKNVPPVADAGVDFSVSLPTSVVIVNGSGSTDDVGIVKWLWQRDATSLAAGTVLQNSEKTSILLVTNVVPGRYVWNLTVWDDQGASSTDTVSIIVKEGPNYLDEVEILVGVSIENLSLSQLTVLLQKLQLLLHNSTSDMTFTLLSIQGRPMAGKVLLVVLGNRNGKVMKGTLLVQELKEKTTNYRDKILNLPILNVDTVVCQNNCSGHGDCIQSTKECRCHSWWMESFIQRHFGESTPNCDWSVVYMFVGAVGSAILLGVFLWLFYVLLAKKIRFPKQRKTKTPQYSLLDACEENLKLPARIHNALLDSATETDSETEIMFETRNSKQRSDKHKNGFLKMQKIRA